MPMKPALSPGRLSPRMTLHSLWSSATRWLLVTGLALGAGVAARAESADGGITDAQIRDVLTRVAHHQIRPLAAGDMSPVKSLAEAETALAPIGINWEYPWGVTLTGLQRAQDVVADPEVAALVAQHNAICGQYYVWLAGLRNIATNNSERLTKFYKTTHLRQMMTVDRLDYCGAMGGQLLEYFQRHPDAVTPEEKMLAAQPIDWVLHRQPRLPDGTFWRPTVMGGTIWPDDLYMGGVFLVRYGLYAHDLAPIHDAAQQLIHQAALEQDTDGLWFHGYLVGEHRHAPLKWGRANGWVILTLVETLDALPKDDPLRAPLLDILRKQFAGLKAVQAPDGRWRQILDHPDLWEETSCTAMFAYGLAHAAHAGWIDTTNLTVARHAFAGIATEVNADGAVAGTCIGTGIGQTVAFYRGRPQGADDYHGRGPVLLAAAELLRSGQ